MFSTNCNLPKHANASGATGVKIPHSPVSTPGNQISRLFYSGNLQSAASTKTTTASGAVVNTTRRSIIVWKYEVGRN